MIRMHSNSWSNACWHQSRLPPTLLELICALSILHVYMQNSRRSVTYCEYCMLALPYCRSASCSSLMGNRVKIITPARWGHLFYLLQTLYINRPNTNLVSLTHWSYRLMYNILMTLRGQEGPIVKCLIAQTEWERLRTLENKEQSMSIWRASTAWAWHKALFSNYSKEWQ